MEIGPFDTPVLRGPRVQYCDVLSADELRSRAAHLGRKPAGVPEIDFVTPNGDLSEINRSFQTVFSSHCIEHQPDLIHHINQVDELLEPGGAYWLLIPDKRFCFDHFLPASHLGDVIQAHEEKRRTHQLQSVVEHRALTTHNFAWKHWIGLHRDPGADQRVARVIGAVREYRAAAGGYVDVHAWQFTPDSFLSLMGDLKRLGYIKLHPEVVWKTPFARLEFAALLRKKNALPPL